MALFMIDWPHAHSPAAGPPLHLPELELIGTPIEVGLLERLERHWERIQDRLIAEIDKDYHLFEGRVFKQELFVNGSFKQNIDWPTTRVRPTRFEGRYIQGIIGDLSSAKINTPSASESCRDTIASSRSR